MLLQNIFRYLQNTIYCFHFPYPFRRYVYKVWFNVNESVIWLKPHHNFNISVEVEAIKCLFINNPFVIVFLHVYMCASVYPRVYMLFAGENNEQFSISTILSLGKVSHGCFFGSRINGESEMDGSVLSCFVWNWFII